MRNTLAYYNTFAREFFDRTVDLKLETLHSKFLEHIPEGGHILDFGCGSGRDAKAFLDKGYVVTAIDGSPELAELASKYIGQVAHASQFNQLDSHNEFDGVWANASLLHVPYDEMDDVLRRVSNAMKPGAALFVNFKKGPDHRVDQSRDFYDMDEERVRKHFAKFFDVQEVWITDDSRPRPGAAQWVNTLCTKS
ncbi:MAG: class I SAM-dependent methyltransferase [Alphaproteobacteria bacterium]